MNLLARLLSVTFISALCMTQAHATSDPRGSNTAKMIDIAPNTVDCFGVGPMKCLVVDGELFYDKIAGYSHVNGQAVDICVEVANQDSPHPADTGSQSYRRIDNANCGINPRPVQQRPSTIHQQQTRHAADHCHSHEPSFRHHCHPHH